MKKHLFGFALLSLLLRCASPASPDKPAATAGASAYRDAAQSSFEITRRDSMAGVSYKIVEVNYQVAYIAPKGETTHYLAKYTATTTSCTGCEGRERSIAIDLSPLDQPEQKTLHIEHTCDEIILEADHYRTVAHGCCGAEDALALYDYGNQLIVAGTGKIVTASIPNSPIALRVAYQPNQEADSTLLGVVTVAYGSAERYEIRLRAEGLPATACPPFSPDISIHSTDTRDQRIEGSQNYDLWSLDGVDQITRISQLTLRIALECDEGVKIKAVEIPLIEGKPFGKTERRQDLTVARL